MDHDLIIFREKVTKEYLLQNITEEEIFEAFGIPVKEGIFCSPKILRIDRKPTCNFFRHYNGSLWYRDFSGYFKGDCFNLVQFLEKKAGRKCNYPKSLEIIAERFNLYNEDGSLKGRIPKIIEVKIEKKDNLIIEVHKQNFTNIDKQYWLSFDIHKKTLIFFKVSSCLRYYLNGNLSYIYNNPNPCYCFELEGSEYKLYKPYDNVRFIHSNPFLILGWEQLPKHGEIVIITKSLKDVMYLYELGIPAIAPMSENVDIDSYYLDILFNRFKNVYCLFDRDKTGIKASIKLKNEGVNPLLFPYSFPKDLTDNHLAFGKSYIINIINYLTNVTKSSNLQY